MCMGVKQQGVDALVQGGPVLHVLDQHQEELGAQEVGRGRAHLPECDGGGAEDGMAVPCRHVAVQAGRRLEPPPERQYALARQVSHARTTHGRVAGRF